MFCDFVCDMVFSQSSPSLVALEVDSEEDMAETNVLPPPRSSDVEKRAEKVKVASRQLPDLTCTRSKSASSAFDPATKVHNKGRRPRNSFSKALISLWTKFFFFLFRTWTTREFDCVPIPTLPRKSVSVPHVSHGTVRRRT